jgi:hypothetical protein
MMGGILWSLLKRTATALMQRVMTALRNDGYVATSTLTNVRLSATLQRYYFTWTDIKLQ